MIIYLKIIFKGRKLFYLPHRSLFTLGTVLETLMYFVICHLYTSCLERPGVLTPVIRGIDKIEAMS